MATESEILKEMMGKEKLPPRKFPIKISERVEKEFPGVAHTLGAVVEKGGFGTQEEATPNSFIPLGLEENKSNTEKLAAYQGAINIAEGKIGNLEQDYYTSISKSKEEVANFLANDEKNKKLRAAGEALEDLLDRDVMEFKALGSGTPELIQEIEKEAGSILAPELAFIDSTAEVPTDPEERMELAENMYYARLLSELWEDTSAGEISLGVVDLLLYPDWSKDLADITEGTYVGSADAWKKFVFEFQSLPRAERLEAAPIIMNALARETGKIEGLIFFQQLLDPFASTQISIDHAIDKLDAAGTLTLIASATGKLVRGANLVRQMQKLGNIKTAAATTQAAIESEIVAKAAGISKLDAAASASPIKIPEELLNGAPEGLSDTVKLNMQAIDETIVDAHQRALSEGLDLNPAEIQAAVDKRRKILEDQPNVENVEVVVADEAGVTFKFDSVTKGEPYKETDRIFFDLQYARKEAKRLKALAAEHTGQKIKDTKFAEKEVVRLKDLAAKAPTKKAKAALLAEATKVTKLAKILGGKSQKVKSNAMQKKLLAGAAEATKLGDKLRRKITKAAKEGRVSREFNQSYTVSDITGGFELSKINGVGIVAKLASPNFIFKADRARLVETFNRLMFASEVHRTAYNKALDLATAGLGKEGRAKLDLVLMTGNRNEKVYAYNDLKYGTGEGLEGIALADNEIESYYSLRHIMDQAYVIKNKEVREGLVAQGLKHIDYGAHGSVVKPLNSLTAALQSIRNTGHKTGYLKTPDGKLRAVNLAPNPNGTTNAQVAQLYEDGHILVRASDTDFFNINKDLYSKYLIVKADEVKEIPHYVLSKKVGYVPQRHKDGFYFVKQKVHGVVDGDAEIVSRSTVRYFDNATDAKTLASKLNAESKSDDFLVLHDRQMSNAEFDKEVTGISGSLYTGARKSTELRKGLDGTEPEYVPALESIQGYFDHLSSRTPMSLYRMGIEQRWMNHARELGGITKFSKKSFSDAVDEVKRSDIDPSAKQMLVESHVQIQYQNRVPTQGEREINTKTRALAEWLEGVSILGLKAPKGLVKNVHKLDHQDPISAIRSATFHSFLGLLSPAQYLVQSFGATVALSIEPTLFGKAFPRMMAIQMLDNITNPVAKAQGMKLISKKMGMPDLEEAYNAWNRTGLRESIVTSSADYASMVRSHPIGRGQMGRLADKGLAPYKAGELVNRRYSFLTSYLKFKKDNPGKVIRDKELKGILDTASQYMLLMTRANKAYWQKGVLSIPTQFLQVHTKFVEALLGDQFTRAERIRLLAMQYGIFGAAGIPFGKWATEEVISFAGLQPGDISETAADGLKEGIVGLTYKSMLGVDVEITKRGAIGLGIEQLLENMLLGDANLIDVATGASGGLADRGFDALGNVWGILHSADFDVANLSAADAAASIDATLDIFSSYRGASLAYQLFNNPLLVDSKGRATVYTDQNLQTKIVVGLGFRPEDLEKIYLSNQTDKVVNQRIADGVNSLMKIMHLRFSGDTNLSPERKRHLTIAIESILAAEKSPGVRKKIREGFLRAVGKGDTKEALSMQRFFKRVRDDIASPSDVLSPDVELLRKQK